MCDFCHRPDFGEFENVYASKDFILKMASTKNGHRWVAIWWAPEGEICSYITLEGEGRPRDITVDGGKDFLVVELWSDERMIVVPVGGGHYIAV